MLFVSTDDRIYLLALLYIIRQMADGHHCADLTRDVRNITDATGATSFVRNVTLSLIGPVTSPWEDGCVQQTPIYGASIPCLYIVTFTLLTSKEKWSGPPFLGAGDATA